MDSNYFYLLVHVMVDDFISPIICFMKISKILYHEYCIKVNKIHTLIFCMTHFYDL